ncbi:MAG: hypothetical protein L0271_27140 [Gemmatimonadetes bacterium]|nr:hypothetical protein [Gemmatimonadota bacterium]
MHESMRTGLCHDKTRRESRIIEIGEARARAANSREPPGALEPSIAFSVDAASRRCGRETRRGVVEIAGVEDAAGDGFCDFGSVVAALTNPLTYGFETVVWRPDIQHCFPSIVAARARHSAAAS